MNHLLRMLAWYADTVLSICYPEPEPPAVEEEVRSGFNEMTFTRKLSDEEVRTGFCDSGSVVLSPPDRSWVGFEDGFGRPVSSPVVAGQAPGETPGGSGHSPVPAAGHLDEVAEGLAQFLFLQVHPSREWSSQDSAMRNDFVGRAHELIAAGWLKPSPQ
jgi:hypothetical protein